MTKEEQLRQEAEKFARTEMSHPNEYGMYYCTFLKVAEPREKRIAELEDKLANADYQLEGRDNEIRELEAQIEKMKWHKVSDNDLPKDRHNVYVVYLNGDYQLEKTIASFRHKYWVINGLKTECEIIAWCELPKWEIKEK